MKKTFLDLGMQPLANNFTNKYTLAHSDLNFNSIIN